MKQHYQKKQPWSSNDPEDFVYSLKWGGYHRRIKTSQEIRRNIGDRHDFRVEHVKGIRARRNKKNLDSWNDFNVSRDYKKSWKDYTRFERQWMSSDQDIVRLDRPPWIKSLFDAFHGL